MGADGCIRYQKIRQRLQSTLSISLKDRWIEDCINFFKTMPDFGNWSEEFLFLRMKDQILCGDLEDISTGSLPSHVLQANKTILPGNYLVQIEEFVNISEIKEKCHLDSKNRALKMTISDGIQRLAAIELSFIPQISLGYIEPGAKVILKRPFVMHGILVLKSENMEVLGGRIQWLVEYSQLIKKRLEMSAVPKEWKDVLGKVEGNIHIDLDDDEQENESNDDKHLTDPIIRDVPSKNPTKKNQKNTTASKKTAGTSTITSPIKTSGNKKLSWNSPTKVQLDKFYNCMQNVNTRQINLHPDDCSVDIKKPKTSFSDSSNGHVNFIEVLDSND